MLSHTAACPHLRRLFPPSFYIPSRKLEALSSESLTRVRALVFLRFFCSRSFRRTDGTRDRRVCLPGSPRPPPHPPAPRPPPCHHLPMPHCTQPLLHLSCVCLMLVPQNMRLECGHTEPWNKLDVILGRLPTTSAGTNKSKQNKNKTQKTRIVAMPDVREAYGRFPCDRHRDKKELLHMYGDSVDFSLCEDEVNKKSWNNTRVMFL